MKTLLLKSTVALSVLLILSACGNTGDSTYYAGELRGEANRPAWDNILPYGMVYIPSGTYTSGLSDQDINGSKYQSAKTITVQGFYLDETEITNNEYRQFVNWVLDSIGRKMVAEELDRYSVITTDPITEDEVVYLNYEEPLFDAEDPEVIRILEPLYVSSEDRVYGRKVIDYSKVRYSYEWFDFKEASRTNNRNRPKRDFIRRVEAVEIYPDTLVWVDDYSYSYNEPMSRSYFAHPAYDAYPVVGVNWNQARYFNVWRSRYYNDYRMSQGLIDVDLFRLPTEFEWEYAARGSRDGAPYPWGGPYVRNSKGCILANFKPGRGAYPEDGGLYTVRADAYWPNDYGLYNMAGNVAEWTSSAFVEQQNSFIHDLNPTIQLNERVDMTSVDPTVNPTMMRKVIRGGSWKDIAFMIQTGTRQYEYKDSAKSYIGFRSLMTFLGRSINDQSTPN